MNFSITNSIWQILCWNNSFSKTGARRNSKSQKGCACPQLMFMVIRFWVAGRGVEATVQSWASASLSSSLEVFQAPKRWSGAPWKEVWNCTGLQMLMPELEQWTRWQQNHPSDYASTAGCRLRDWSEEDLQTGERSWEKTWLPSLLLQNWACSSLFSRL